MEIMKLSSSSLSYEGLPTEPVVYNCMVCLSLLSWPAGALRAEMSALLGFYCVRRVGL